MQRIKRLLMIFLFLLVLVPLVEGAITDNLISHYQLDGDATDRTGTHDGTNKGATENTTSYICGSAMDFDGVNDWIDLDYNFTEDENFTWSLWVRINGNTGADYIFDATPGTNGYLLRYNTGLFTGYLYNSTGSAHATTHSDNIATWTHIVYSFNSSDVCLYINGTQDSCKAVTGGLGVANTHSVLGANVWGSDNFNGILDEAVYWNRSLNTSEIETLNTISTRCSWYIDNPPTINITSPSVNTTYVSNQTLILNLTDDNGLSNITIISTDGEINHTNNSLSGLNIDDYQLFLNMTHGNHTLNITVWDDAGQSSTGLFWLYYDFEISIETISDLFTNLNDILIIIILGLILLTFTILQETLIKVPMFNIVIAMGYFVYSPFIIAYSMVIGVVVIFFGVGYLVKTYVDYAG